MAEYPKRKIIRLQGYDYSHAGYYFITICTQNRIHYFGDIIGTTLCGRPNNPHIMIESWLLELENKFADITLGPYVIMPNHIHVILQKDTTGDNTGATLRDVIGWFKTMTTNEYIRNVRRGLYNPFHKKLWQRNYHEHIIKDENDYIRITEYIRDNPALWACDSLRKELTND